MPRRDWDNDRDDRPRRRRFEDDDEPVRHRGGGGVPTALIVGGIGLILLLVVGLVAAGFFAFRQVRVVAVQQQAAAVAPEEAAAAQAAGPGGIVAVPGGVPVATEGQGVLRIVYGGGPGGVTALVGVRRDAAGTRIEVFDTPSGRARGKVVTENISINEIVVNPDGKWLAVIVSAPFEGHQVTLHDVATGNQVGQFRPYSRAVGDGLNVPELVWAAFVAPDKLLTINEASGFDLWTVPGFERVAGRPPRQAHAQPRVSVNGFTHSPNNFGLTPDGKTLALFTGNGFSFYDARTADLLGQTEPILKDRGSANFWGAALRADGSQFVCHYATYGAAGPESVVAVWDVPTGRRVSAARPANRASSAGLGWLNKDHLAIWQGGVSSADVMRVSTGDVVGKIRMPEIGKIGTMPPGDGLWGFVERTADGRDNPRLIRADLPATFRPGAWLRFGAEGLRPE